MVRWASRVLILALVFAVTLPAEAQFGRRRNRVFSFDPTGNVDYGEQFTFVRLRYNSGWGGGRNGPGWLHDYPRADAGPR